MNNKNSFSPFRDIENELNIALNFSKIILIFGSTKTGKTTLLKKYKKGRAYYDLRKNTHFELAKNHPEVFIKRIKYPCIIENIEQAKDLLPLIYSEINNIEPGAIILTSDQIPSQSLERFIKTADNKISAFELSYNSYFKINGINCFDLNFNNLKLPYNLESEDNILKLAKRAYKYGDELNKQKLIQKLREEALKLNYTALEIDLIDKLLLEVAKLTGKSVNISNLANKFEVNKHIINSIINLLIRYKVIYKLSPINDEELNYVVKTEKIYFNSINLVCSLLQIKNEEILLLSDYRKEILENYLINMIQNQYKSKGRNVLFNFYENTNGVKVDLIINNIGKVNLIQFQLKVVNEKKLKQAEKIFSKTRLKIGQSLVISYDIDRTYDNTVFSLITPTFFA